jgi:magnesium-protoporphyrin O-methyltransferase
LVDIARRRLDLHLHDRVDFRSGDMLDPALGTFDHVLAMDSLIYYTAADIGEKLSQLSPRVSQNIVFTVAPRTPFLLAFWGAGKLFPRSDRSPVMIPHATTRLRREMKEAGSLRDVKRVTSGFYISNCLELRT